MKRVEAKVRDIVEVRPFPHLHDFAADPAMTLSNYYFTDITSDLMGKWLDRFAAVRPGSGAAIALAGFRGVGKSHFLATLAAIISQPELRNKITDLHVAASSERLGRRHVPVIYVLRGAYLSLLEELKSSLITVFGPDIDTGEGSIKDVLSKASEKSGDSPLVIIVDTALDRNARVDRDDGGFLSEVAGYAKELGLFIGLALEDDIAGADGPNSSISSSYTIDYLDQEHLYKIVDTHIFAKNERARILLHDIYQDYSSLLPGFRWSEQRFISLYPLHPATLEMAPLIRLYLQDFAFLGFAAEAAAKIMGRPANSLIGIDEIFDAVEKPLRNVPQLKDLFAAYDQLVRDCIADVPVGIRLSAKLILKGLFMLSLDGQALTANEIAASMLIFSDDTRAANTLDVSALLDSFAALVPHLITRTVRDKSETRYCFKTSGEDDLTAVLDEAVGSVTTDDVFGVLLRIANEKFADMPVAGESLSVSCTIEWRGSLRRGEVHCCLGQDRCPDLLSNAPDWAVYLTNGGVATLPRSDKCLIVEWRIADFRPEESDAIRRLYLLQTDADIRQRFAEKLTAAIQIQSMATGRIWQRVFFSDAVLVSGNDQRGFSSEAQATHTVAQLLTIELASYLDERFPAHPFFGATLGVKEAARLTGQLFGGSDPNDAEVQQLAELFALPLGLVELQENNFVPVSDELVTALPTVRAAFDDLDRDETTVLSLADLAAAFRKPPFGLSREAQHLILSALVAQRQLEFVTSGGNRINHRSLDLQLIWDDVTGVSRPLVDTYSNSRLSEWATLLTGISQRKSLNRPEDRLAIIDSLCLWLSDWNEERILDAFDQIEDESINASVWRMASNVRKTMGAVAQYVEEIEKEGIPLDVCLGNIADLFCDSETEFQKKQADLRAVREFTNGTVKRNEILTYLALCDVTDDSEIEDLRRSLLETIGRRYFSSGEFGNGEMNDLWERFLGKFTAYYINAHDANYGKTGNDELELILNSEEWGFFKTFSELPSFDRRFDEAAKGLMREIYCPECEADTGESLTGRPYCSCLFRIGTFDRRNDKAARLKWIIRGGLIEFRKQVIEKADMLASVLGTLPAMSGNVEYTVLLKLLSDPNNTDLTALSSGELSMLRTAFELIGSSDDSRQAAHWLPDLEETNVFADQ